jgi:exonuclease III
MAKFLRIALWNANGLAQHKDEILLFLQHNKIDILFISETHFTTKSSTTEAPSTELNYNPIWIPYYDPYHEKMSYGV